MSSRPESWQPRSVCIVGVGLLGGSVGLAVRRRWPETEVVGVARRAEKREAALRRGAVTRCAESLADGVRGAEFIVIGAPVGAVTGLVRASAETCAEGAVITDVGSTKGAICEAADADPRCAPRFVGSHPLAGGEKTGVENARAELFDGRTTVITPTPDGDPARADRVEAFWRALGARTRRMTPEAHDAAVAAVSHVPHVVAAALAAALPPEFRELTSTGWRDTTRIAAGDPGMWRQILETNTPHVLGELDRFAAVLEEYRAALRAGDHAGVERLLEQGQRARQGK